MKCQNSKQSYKTKVCRRSTYSVNKTKISEFTIITHECLKYSSNDLESLNTTKQEIDSSASTIHPFPVCPKNTHPLYITLQINERIKG